MAGSSVLQTNKVGTATGGTPRISVGCVARYQFQGGRQRPGLAVNRRVLSGCLRAEPDMLEHAADAVTIVTAQHPLAGVTLSAKDIDVARHLRCLLSGDA